jgi:HEPN domain-containing protein
VPNYRSPPRHEAPAALRPLDLLARAEEFFSASSQIVHGQDFLEWPRYFCLCHAIELALKAWLAFKGEDEARLRDYGHDLKEAMESAQGRELSLSPTTVRAINLLSPVHKQLLPRYPVRTGEPIPSIRQFEKNADEILKAVRNGIASS